MDISYGGDPKNHFRAVLEKWKGGQYPPYDWSTILNVLASPIIDAENLAKSIVEKLQQMSSPLISTGKYLMHCILMNTFSQEHKFTIVTSLVLNFGSRLPFKLDN